MGRAGHRMFDSDQDFDYRSEVSALIYEKLKDAISSTEAEDIVTEYLGEKNTDPEESKYDVESYLYDGLLKKDPERARALLDGGIAQQIFKELREQALSSMALRTPHGGWNSVYFNSDAGYKIIILALLVMPTGAAIGVEDIAAARHFLPNISIHPAKVQVEAGLNNYCAGHPRTFDNYYDPSCFNCGKMECDLNGEKLLSCKCDDAWYCNAECQRANKWYHEQYAYGECDSPELVPRKVHSRK